MTRMSDCFNSTNNFSQIIGCYKATLNYIPFTVYQIFFILFNLLGTCGNVLIIIAVVRDKTMRTSTNLFILNLAISDLSLCAFTQPFNLYRIKNTDFTLGLWMCKIGNMFQATNVFVSTICITAISLDRVQAIFSRVPRVNRNQKSTIIVMLLTWLVSVLWSSPLGYMNIIENNKCVERRDLTEIRFIYSCANLVLLYLAPLLIVSICYLHIIIKMKNRNKILARSAINNNNGLNPETNDIALTKTRQAAIKKATKRRKTIMILISIAVVFAISWLPINIKNMVNVNSKTDNSNQSKSYNHERIDEIKKTLSNVYETFNNHPMVFASYFFISLSAFLNPFLYAWLNSSFRKAFQELYQSCRKFCCNQKCSIKCKKNEININGRLKNELGRM